jgi:hypothetical protein
MPSTPGDSGYRWADGRDDARSFVRSLEELGYILATGTRPVKVRLRAVRLDLQKFAEMGFVGRILNTVSNIIC